MQVGPGAVPCAQALWGLAGLEAFRVEKSLWVAVESILSA